MRQRPKPFTVEIKKSRKPGAEPQSLFGGMFDGQAGLQEAPSAVPERSADKLFARTPVEADALALAGQVFGAAPATTARPETRILPDLTARPAIPAEEEPRRRAERVKPSPKPKAVKPKPIAIEIVVRPQPVQAAAPAAALAARPVRVRSRRDDGALLPRGERWKRRLTPFAR